MESVEIMFSLLGLFLLVYTWNKVEDPKLDWNYETGERILWYNDPFDSCIRKSITIWKSKI